MSAANPKASTAQVVARIGADNLRRGPGPILSSDECRPGPEVQLSPDELANIKIDHSYQRSKLTNKVNELVAVLKSGGTIPDPISVAVRPDESRWIVDGQQRWWAALDAERPLTAKLFYVRDREAELKLFTALNNSTALTAGIVIGAWSGPANEALHMLDEDAVSPIRGRVNWKGKQTTTFGIAPILRSTTALLSGGQTITGGITEVLKTFDAYWNRNAKWSKRAALTYATIMQRIFPDVQAQSFRAVNGVALARSCHLRWERLYEGERIEWPVPVSTQYDKLRLLDWSRLCPTSGGVWLPQVQAAIEDVWPLPAAVRSRLGRS